jgi:hypothetical protein
LLLLFTTYLEEPSYALEFWLLFLALTCIEFELLNYLVLPFLGLTLVLELCLCLYLGGVEVL